MGMPSRWSKLKKMIWLHAIKRKQQKGKREIPEKSKPESPEK